MKRTGPYSVVAALSLMAAPVLAQDAPIGQPLGDSVPGQDGQRQGQHGEALPNGVQPSTAAPTVMPELPPTVPEPQQLQEQGIAPTPATAPVVVAPVAPVPGGQWIYTAQYGWVWTPYAQAYTYVAPDANVAQMYVFRVGLGWGWVLAPWVFGIGPVPYWGVYGYSNYAWYCRPWFHAWYGPRPSYAWGHFYGRYNGAYSGWAGRYHGYWGNRAAAGGYHMAPAPVVRSAQPTWHAQSPAFHGGNARVGNFSGGRIGGYGGHGGGFSRMRIGGGMHFGGHHR